MAEGVILLNFWASACAMRARVALAEKGLEYEPREQELENNSDFLLQMNPVTKMVPVLIHNGKAVWESLIVVRCIDEVWKDKTSLLPSEPYQRAQARFWANFVDQKIFGLGRKIWQTKGEEQRAAFAKELMECFKLLEKELGDKHYFGGETLGPVDIAFLPFWFSSSVSEVFNPQCPKLDAWAKRCMQRESVSKSLPEPGKLHAFIECQKKKSRVS